MTEAPSPKWTRISKLYGEAIHRSSEARFAAFRLSTALARTLVEQLGCREEIVSHYAYNVGDAPKWDTFKLVKSPFDSVVLTDNDWVFGIGVTIEISETHWPKNTLVVPVTATIHGDDITATTPITQATYMFQANGDNDEAIKTFASDFIDGIEIVVERWAKGHAKNPRVGFATINE